VYSFHGIISSIIKTMRFVAAVGVLLSLSTAASFGVQRQPGVTRRNNNLAFSRLPNALVIGRGGQQPPSSLSATVSSGAITEENLKVLSARGRKAVYGGWPDAGVDDEGKQKLAEQVRRKT
jgi:hypothetical protein